MTQATPQIQSRDLIDPARIAALNVTLGIGGDAARPFCHQVFFWEAQPAEALGRDGHPKVGGLIPDFGLPRRMWAGGRLWFHTTPAPGVEATRTTSLIKAERKTGRSGDLGIVTLRHEIAQSGRPIVTDEQDLIYREDAQPGARKPAPIDAPKGETLAQERRFSSTQLFRYSALTFNGHRIHYDRDYARDVEGYGGLVVHGPLLAQYLMLMAEDHLGGLNHFDFRARAPLFDTEPARFCAKPSGNGLEMWVTGGDGRLCMSASAQ